MAIYTKLDKVKINSILSNYSLGNLKKFEGIKEGIENTNYSIETDKGKEAIEENNNDDGSIESVPFISQPIKKKSVRNKKNSS